MSHLAIDLDGSNNGLQHYSAIMRSPEEAEKVNLIRRPEPADVYEIVATEVRKLIAEDTDEKTREVRERWLAFNDGKGPSRKEAKRCVMTSLYGSEEYGFRDHLMEDLMDKLTNKVLAGELDNHPLAITDTWGKEDGGSRAATYLAGLIDQALEKVLSKTEDAKKWLRDTARALVKVGHDLRWETPIGLPVVLHRKQMVTKELHTWLYDRRMAPKDAKRWDRVNDDKVERRHQVHVQYEEDDEGKLSPHKQRNGIAPNLIHSLDASHLMLTVEAAAAEGINHVLTIHDCYATHAGDTERFAQILRERFVRMYQDHDPLEALRRYAEDHGAEVDPVPTKGDFNLAEVLESPYFFA